MLFECREAGGEGGGVELFVGARLSVGRSVLRAGV